MSPDSDYSARQQCITIGYRERYEECDFVVTTKAREKQAVKVFLDIPGSIEFNDPFNKPVYKAYLNLSHFLKED